MRNSQGNNKKLKNKTENKQTNKNNKTHACFLTIKEWILCLDTDHSDQPAEH